MSKEISPQTEGKRSFRSLLGLSSKSNQDPVITEINKLLGMPQVKKDSDIKQHLLNLLEHQQDLLKIEIKLAKLLNEQNTQKSQSTNINYAMLNNMEKTSSEKQKKKLKQLNKNIFIGLYYKLPEGETRDNLVSLLEISQEMLDAQKNVSSSQVVKTLKVESINYEEAIRLITESVHNINLDNPLKEQLAQIFSMKAAIAHKRKDNIDNNKQQLNELIRKKNQILKTVESEASRLKKLTEAEQQTHATSIKFQAASQRLKDLNVEINGIKNAGVYNSLNELRAFLLKHPNLDTLVKELGVREQQLPDGKLKQALAEVIQPKINRKGDVPAFSMCWSTLEQSLLSPNETKPARASVNQIIIEEESLTIGKGKVTAQATSTPESISWIGSWIAPVKKWFQNLWHTNSGPKQQSITQQIQESDNAEDTLHDKTQTSDWLHDNFPPKAASWLGNLWQGFKASIGMGPKPPSSNTVTKAQAQLLLEVNKFIDNFEQHKIVEKQTSLANCQHLIKQLEEQLPNAPSSVHARQKLQAIIHAIEPTLARPSESQQTTATQIADEHISLKKR